MSWEYRGTLKRVLLAFSLLFCFIIGSSQAALREDTLQAFQDELVKVVDKASKSVVTVMGGYTYQQTPLYEWYKQFEGTPYEDFFKQFLEQMETSPAILGSGVIVEVDGKTGYIVTNSHVVLPVLQNNLPLQVKLYDGTMISDVQIIKVMRSVDLALLKVKLPFYIPPIPFADSSKIKVGQLAIAIGNPFGLEHTVTLGIISATGRKISTIEGFNLADMIQTDAALNPGNSGGALIDIHGRLIGINTAIYSPTRSYAGIGFAIPSNVVKKFLELSLAGGGSFTGPKPFLGVDVIQVPLSIASRMGIKGGVMVVNVRPDSPAEKAGILPQDIIVQVDDQPITTVKELVDYILSKQPGDLVKVKVLRGGRVLTLKVRLGRR